MSTTENHSDKDKEAQKQQHKALGALETSGERLRRRGVGLLYLVVCLVLSVGAWSAGWLFTSLSGGPAESEVWGTAETRSCEQTGPVTLYGVGHWWNCTAEINWYGQSQSPETVTVKGSELTPQDVGKQVRVTSKDFGKTYDHDDSAQVYRDTTRPFWFMNVVMWVVIAVLVGVAAVSGLPRAFFPLSEWFNLDKKKALKYWKKYEREGRLTPELARQQPPRVEPTSSEPPQWMQR